MITNCVTVFITINLTLQVFQEQELSFPDSFEPHTITFPDSLLELQMLQIFISIDSLLKLLKLIDCNLSPH
jgi:hypothetical protein